MRDEELDALLRADAAAGPADLGFTETLLRRLPARRQTQRRRSRLPERTVQLMALTTALLALGLLWPSLLAEVGAGTEGGQRLEAASTTLVLLVLIVAWTLPQGRLNPWR